MSAPTDRQRLGQRGERLAKQFLISRGYVIEETNARFPVGEIDLVAREGETLCFVEVRSTASAVCRPRRALTSSPSTGCRMGRRASSSSAAPSRLECVKSFTYNTRGVRHYLRPT